MAADNHESESEPDEIIVYPPYLEYIGAFFEAWKFVEAGAKSEAENPDTDADADAAAFPNNNYPINPELTGLPTENFDSVYNMDAGNGGGANGDQAAPAPVPIFVGIASQTVKRYRAYTMDAYLMTFGDTEANRTFFNLHYQGLMIQGRQKFVVVVEHESGNVAAE